MNGLWLHQHTILKPMSLHDPDLSVLCLLAHYGLKIRGRHSQEQHANLTHVISFSSQAIATCSLPE
uniref:Uncharacterized protein n=1 Tax=Anguilla anguilla TaxID=7936 RepID=A0A0E9UL81_ANGAN